MGTLVLRALGFLCFAIMYLSQGIDAASIMTPASVPLNITASLSGTYQDIYIEADNHVFLLLTTANLYRLDPLKWPCGPSVSLRLTE